jgi:hypothetical protein
MLGRSPDDSVSRALSGVQALVVQREQHEVFVSCFSESADDLQQWKAYGANGYGYAIGLSVMPGMLDIQPSPVTYKVIYDRSTQAALLDSMLRTVADRIRRVPSVAKAGADPAILDAFIAQLLSDILERYAMALCPCMKNAAYSHEREFRLTIPQGPMTEQKIPQKTRLRGNYLVPCRWSSETASFSIL